MIMKIKSKRLYSFPLQWKLYFTSIIYCGLLKFRSTAFDSIAEKSRTIKQCVNGGFANFVWGAFSFSSLLSIMFNC